MRKYGVTYEALVAFIWVTGYEPYSAQAVA
jgi:hypothetical protein